MPAAPPIPGSLGKLTSTIAALARVMAGSARGRSLRALADIVQLDPDTVGMGKLIGLHASLAASNGGLDVDVLLNPEYDVAIHGCRAAVEVGTAEATANSGLASFNAAHCSVKLWDPDRTVNLFESKSPAAGGSSSGGIDLMLLGANHGPLVELPVPYVFKGRKGAATLRATFATDASWPGTRRAGLMLTTTYARRSFRQAESA